MWWRTAPGLSEAACSHTRASHTMVMSQPSLCWFTCPRRFSASFALTSVMDPISALQYLSREQLESLVHRLQDEVANLRHQLADAEERNRILQFALPQLVRECFMDTVHKIGPVPLSVPKDISEATVDPPVTHPSAVTCASIALQTDPEHPSGEQFCSVQTQTVARFNSPVQLDAGRVTVVEPSVTASVPSSTVELQMSNPLPSLSGPRRRKRKSSPARVTGGVSLAASSKQSENMVPRASHLNSNLSSLNGDVIGLSTNETKRQKPIVVGFHNLTTKHLMRDSQTELTTAEPEQEKSGSSNDDCVLLTVDDQTHSEADTKPENPCELSVSSMPPPPPLFSSVFPTSLPLCLINGSDSGASDNYLEDGGGHTEMDWNDFIRVRDEIVSDPNIVMGRHWALYRAASEWTRATCAIMSALFDADQMANCTVLGRSSTEPRDRLPSDRVNFIVTTICRQFGVSASKVRARMAQKCKDERRKRRLILQQNSLEDSPA